MSLDNHFLLPFFKEWKLSFWGAEINPHVLDYLSDSAWRMTGEYLQGASKGELVGFNLILKSSLQTLVSIIPENRSEFSSDQKTN